MRYSFSLRFVLPALTAALVVAVVASVGILSVGLLRRLGDQQSVERVRWAGLAAVREFAQTGEDVEVDVRLLAERPTLRRLLEERRIEALRDFLTQFTATGRLDGCAVVGPEMLVASGDPGLPWQQIAKPLDSPGPGWSLFGVPAEHQLLVGAGREVHDTPGTHVACAHWLDERFAKDVSDQIGVPVTIVGAREVRASGGDALAALRGRAVAQGLGGSARVDAAGAFVDVQPLRDRSGTVVAIVETRLGTAGVDGSVKEILRTLRLGIAASAAIAALAAFLLARRLTEPLATLSRASSRIGAGDLDSPIPRTSSSEIGQLADTMEEMRRRLLRLTSELRRRHAEAAAILTGIVEGVWAVDRERRITWMNPQAAEGLHIRVEDAVGKFCGDVLNPRLPGGGRPCDTSCPIVDARFRGSARATEHLVLADGSRRTVVITSAPTVAESEGGDRESRQFQVLRDETETEAGRRMRDAVLANVSHEFRTPLSAQLASLEMLRDRIDEQADPDVTQLLRAMERGTLRLVRLVDNLLEGLRIDAGRDSIRLRPVDLGAVVREAIEQVVPLVEQKSQSLEVRLPDSLPVLEGDGPRLVQVFTNLLANANKFAPPQTSISIGGEVTDKDMTIWVRDEGPGFPEDTDERIFEPFRRGAGEEPEERGVGLGLYIANSIVERHGGRLDLRSTGGGAWIGVVLPRVAT